ncbi:cobalamin biosynthesis protein CbiM [Zavarzinia compransoris]|uniref:Cobalamin biosynthesis protein CbiM n=1 Tax=Zavarzinia compransoris TaxID=1264899 RepID=A0A317EAG5_9PROT|nr:cobalamin biosynthesis protein CbiM [Zavarzinia compransoris]PWR23140.1 cobalamin biosynthesis protein CbiM [Zavarzinia compransoris]TDP46305.1 nickel transport protein [Zavarzinia compransoris]
MMRRLLIACAMVVAAASPAAAHRLKLFATVEDGTISGYAFFIGGGRPQGAALVIRGSAGTELYRTDTDAEGRFAWKPAGPDRFTVVVDSRDGHIAEVVLDADRFGGQATLTAPAGTSTGTAAPPAETAAIEAAVDRAVARQVRPLLEAYDEAEGRIRFNDVMGGIGMIIGLAGMALWASARRGRGDK